MLGAIRLARIRALAAVAETRRTGMTFRPYASRACLRIRGAMYRPLDAKRTGGEHHAMCLTHDRIFGNVQLAADLGGREPLLPQRRELVGEFIRPDGFHNSLLSKSIGFRARMPIRVSRKCGKSGITFIVRITIYV